MPIASTDILLKFSVKTGAAGNTTAGTAASSLGKYISTTQITDNTLNNLFDNISGAENAESIVDYRCIFIHNNHGSITFESVAAFLQSEVAGGASIAIGVDPAVASAIGAAPAQAAEIATELVAPVGVTFTSPTTFGTGIAIGNLAPGQCRALWVRRTASNSAALASDGVTLRFQGSSL